MSNTKLVVAFMKLFLPDGFQLDVRSTQYRDDVLGKSVPAEKALLTILLQHNGADHIRRYQQLRAAGRIIDPAPGHTNSHINLVFA
ncbi:hypothetical protein PHMEG_00025372 [Phytophthora megakarya]|uniref:Uncharacterized protein n=1 Tax=Phytophthora megakarya TaxID=4795 RepID=A0A225VC64_9STRA|nr:hypothetical protein PHMEG_00025372 [Phytophthora megakarya]